MKIGVDFKELKEIEKGILKGINLNDIISYPKTVAAFDIAYSGKKCRCVSIVIDIETKEIIEKGEFESEEIIPYSPNLVAFREGPLIINTYRKLKNKPDVLMIKGFGVIHPNKIGLASYVGVMLNKPCFGVSKELTYGKLEEDKIVFNNEVMGMAIRTKLYANPIYVSPGHNISINTAVDITKKTVDEQYKLPLPLHLAHKYVNKLKQDKPKEQEIQTTQR